MRQEFEDAIEQPLVNYGTGKVAAVSERTREREMALFQQASGSM